MRRLLFVRLGRGRRNQAGARERVCFHIAGAGKQRPLEPRADHLPQIVNVDIVAVAIDALGFEDHGVVVHHALLVRFAHFVHYLAIFIRDGQLHPTADDIQRAGGEAVPHLVVDHDDLHIDLLTGLDALRAGEFKPNHRAGGPFVGDFRHFDLAAKPLLGQPDVLLTAGQVHQDRYHLVGSEEAV